VSTRALAIVLLLAAAAPAGAQTPPPAPPPAPASPAAAAGSEASARVGSLLSVLRERTDARLDPAWRDLIALGDTAVAPLVATVGRALATDGADRLDAYTALLALEEMRRPAAVPGLVAQAERLHHWRPRVAIVLARIDAPAAAAALRARLTDRTATTPEARLACARLLAALPVADANGAAAVVEASVAALDDPDPAVRALAVSLLDEKRLALAGERAREPLLAAAAASVPAVRRVALRTLVRLKEPRVLPHLRRALADESAEVATEAVTLIVRLGDAAAAPDLIALLVRVEPGGASEALALVVAQAVGHFKLRAAVPHLVRLLSDVHPSAVKRQAVHALGEIGDPAAFPALVRFHAAVEDAHKGQVLLAVAGIDGAPATAFVAAQLAALAKDDPAAEDMLAAAERRRGAEIGPAVVALLARAEGPLRPRVCETLGRIRYAGGVDPLCAILAEDAAADAPTLHEVLWALGELGDPKAAEPLREFLKRRGPDRQFEATARLALARIDQAAIAKAIERAEEELRRRPYDTSWLNSLGIYYTLAKDYKKGEEQFKKILERDPSHQIAVYNLSCIASLDNRPDEAVELLRRAVKMGMQDWRHMEKDRDLDNIRDHAGYRDVIRGLQGAAVPAVEEEEPVPPGQSVPRIRGTDLPRD